MAGGGRANSLPKYICDIPYPIKKKLCTILDSDKGWEYLAGELGYNSDFIGNLANAFLRRGSPSEDLLSDWSHKNPTVSKLFLKLIKLGKIREAEVIKDQVHPKLHRHLPALEDEEHSLLSFGSSCSSMSSLGSQRSLPMDNYSRQDRFLCTDEIPLPDDPQNDYLNCHPSSPTRLQSGSSPDGRSYMQHRHPTGYISFQPVGATGATIHPSEYKKTKSSHSCEENSQQSSVSRTGCTLSMEQMNFNHASRLTTPQRRNVKEGHKDIQDFIDPSYRQEQNGGCSRLDGGFRASQPVESPDQCNYDTMTQHTKQHIFQEHMPQVKKQNPTISGGLDGGTADLVDKMRIPFEEIQKATGNFNVEQELGRGGFGTVYKGVMRNTDYAIKHLKQKDQHEAELKTLLAYRHENIVQLCGFSSNGTDYLLVYEFMSNGSLEDRLACKNHTQPLTWVQRMTIVSGAANGISYLHSPFPPSRPLIHGDIKSANILLDKHFEAKVSDFGLAREATCGETTGKYTSVGPSQWTEKLYGSRAYLPNEFFRERKLNIKTDSHCFGIVLYEVCTGMKAADEKERILKNIVEDAMENAGLEELKLLSLMDKKGGNWPDECWLSLLKLGKQCTSTKKKQRPTMSEVWKKLKDIQKEHKSEMTDVGPVGDFQLHYDSVPGKPNKDVPSFNDPSSAYGTSPAKQHIHVSPFQLQMTYDKINQAKSQGLPHVLPALNNQDCQNGLKSHLKLSPFPDQQLSNSYSKDKNQELSSGKPQEISGDYQESVKQSVVSEYDTIKECKPGNKDDVTDTKTDVQFLSGSEEEQIQMAGNKKLPDFMCFNSAEEGDESEDFTETPYVNEHHNPDDKNVEIIYPPQSVTYVRGVGYVPCQNANFGSGVCHMYYPSHVGQGFVPMTTHQGHYPSSGLIQQHGVLSGGVSQQRAPLPAAGPVVGHQVVTSVTVPSSKGAQEYQRQVELLQQESNCQRSQHRELHPGTAYGAITYAATAHKDVQSFPSAHDPNNSPPGMYLHGQYTQAHLPEAMNRMALGHTTGHMGQPEHPHMNYVVQKNPVSNHSVLQTDLQNEIPGNVSYSGALSNVGQTQQPAQASENNIKTENIEDSELYGCGNKSIRTENINDGDLFGP